MKPLGREVDLLVLTHQLRLGKSFLVSPAGPGQGLIEGAINPPPQVQPVTMLALEQENSLEQYEIDRLETVSLLEGGGTFDRVYSRGEVNRLV